MSNPRKFRATDFQKAFIIASADVEIDPVKHPTEPLFGCGLPDFKPVVTTIEAVARHIRWQALQFNGEWNIDELEDCKHIARNKFLLES